jgi:cytoskeletal protein CcmA (bactofilin family)
VTAFIDDGCAIEGTYTFTGTTVLNGKLNGSIRGDGSLIVGVTAVVEADIETRSLVVAGQIIGNVTASDRIELKTTARVLGAVEAPVIAIEAGAILDGGCRMVSSPAVPPKLRDALAEAPAG